MSMIILIYPSCRAQCIAESVSRARSKTRTAVRVAVGFNGPTEVPPGVSSTPGGTSYIDHLVYYGPELFNPPYTEAVNRLMASAVRAFNPSDDMLIGYWMDDIYPLTDWAAALLSARRRHPRKRFLCPWDNIMRFKLATIPFATWGWWREHMGGCMWPPMLKYVVDVWPSERAKVTEDWLTVPGCRLEHRHHCSGQRPHDLVDRHNGEIRAACDDDQIIAHGAKTGFAVSWGL